MKKTTLLIFSFLISFISCEEVKQKDVQIEQNPHKVVLIDVMLK